jgi:hypothetical protein
MMYDMMGGSMWGMGIVGVLVVLVLALSLAALIKYLFFRWRELATFRRKNREPVPLD